MNKTKEPRVLVVEDEGIIARDIKNTLSLLGYSVVAVVSSGEEAVKTAMETLPDLVLMDIVLEGAMNGVKAAEQIRDSFDIPVVYLTAYSDDKTLQRAKITEPYGYILKPFQEKELYTTIEMALYKHEMERKLKKNEQWLATTLKSIGDAVIATDNDKLITFMNPVAEALTGWRQEEAIGKPLQDVFKIIAGKTGMEVEESAAELLQDGVVAGLTDHAVLIAKDGTKRPVDDSDTSIRDDKGKIIGAVLIFRDITERKQAEEALWLRIEFQRLVTTLSTKFITLASNEMDDGINFALQEIGKFADVDRSYVFQYYDNGEKMDNTHEWCADGIEPQIQNCQGFLTKDFPWCKERIDRFETIHISNVSDLPPEAVEKEVFASQQIQSLIIVPMIYRKALIGFIGFDSVRGKKVWSKDIIMLLKTVGGMFANIIEHKRSEAQLRESEEKFRAIFECATDGILVADLKTKKFLTGNAMFCKMLGYSYEEIKNLKITDIHPQEDLPYVLTTFEEQARGEYTLAADIPVKRKDGSIFYADINASRISFYGKPCIMGIFRDITKRKRMRDSLLKSKKQLRNLSSSILSAQEQERKRISRELHDDLGQILTAALLDISQAEKQKIHVYSGCYNFRKRLRLILQEALQRVRSLSAILRPGVLDQLGLKAAVISFLEELQEQTGLNIIEEMQVDHSNIPEPISIAIYRILQEATTNIIKYAAAKQVIVTLRSDSKTVSISIKDDGQGFNPESLPIDKGLGLLGMKERAEWLGGVFKIESAHGRGTCIYAEFPLS